ncbi:hypothetical protein D6764_03455 [Candidatus Woesearchaeota archaeon]|nr:MAG: hypothetical protein D6764_03455 [Candidatus Woesearchaeota archaeon]
MRRSTKWFLAAFFLLSLSIRLIIAYNTPYFDDSAYFLMRNIESIQKSGVPLFEDSSIVGNRISFFPPFYHYVMAFLDFFFPLDFSLRIFPNLFASFIVFVSYFLAFELTSNEKAALVASFASLLSPAYLFETVTSASSLSLAAPMFFLSAYFFIISRKNEKYAGIFLASLVFLIFTSTISLLFALSLLLCLLFLRMSRTKVMRSDVELSVFSVFLVLWLYLLLYKRTLISERVSALFQTLPNAVSAPFLPSLAEQIFLVGVVPLLAGIYVIHKQSLVERKRGFYLLLSFVLISWSAWKIKVLDSSSALVILSLSFSVLLADYVVLFSSYVAKLRFSPARSIALRSLVLLLFITSVFPGFYFSSLKESHLTSPEVVDALLWLKYSSPSEEKVVAASPLHSSLVSYVSGSKVVLDRNIHGINHPLVRLQDLINLYRSPFKTSVLEITDRYSITHVLLSDKERAYFGISDIAYSDSRCFKLVYNGYEKVKIYRVLCSLSGSGGGA